MEHNTISELRQLSDEMGVSEEKVIAKAIRSGLQQLRREQILAAYVRGDLSREDAVEQVGIDWVELADRQQQAVKEDLTWALE